MQKLDQDQPQDGGPLESILSSNPLCRGLTCSIAAWSEGGTAADGFVIEAPTLVRTTAELDAWIEKAKTILSDSDGVQVVPIMDFGLRYLSTPFPPDQICYLKRKGWYVSEVDEDSIVWDRNVHRAKALTGLEVSQLQSQYHSCRGAYLVNTSRASFPFNAVIKVTDGEYAGKYIESIEDEIRFCSYAYLARRFRTEEDAKSPATGSFSRTRIYPMRRSNCSSDCPNPYRICFHQHLCENRRVDGIYAAHSFLLCPLTPIP